MFGQKDLPHPAQADAVLQFVPAENEAAIFPAQQLFDLEIREEMVRLQGFRNHRGIIGQIDMTSRKRDKVRFFDEPALADNIKEISRGGRCRHGLCQATLPESSKPRQS
jgi:hypothetical protein